MRKTRQTDFHTGFPCSQRLLLGVYLNRHFEWLMAGRSLNRVKTETAADLVAAARGGQRQAAVREALAGDVGRRRVRTGRRRRGRRRTLADQHDSRTRSSIRSPVARSSGVARADTPARRCGRSRSPVSTPVRRPSSSRSSAWAACVGAHVRDFVAVGASAVALGTILFCGPLGTRARPRELDGVETARRLEPAGPRARIGRRSQTVGGFGNMKNTCKSAKTVLLDHGASLVDSSGSWSRRRRTHRRPRARSTSGWMLSSGRTTSGSAARS